MLFTHTGTNRPSLSITSRASVRLLHPPLASSDHLGNSLESWKSPKAKPVTSPKAKPVKARKVWLYQQDYYNRAHQLITETNWNRVVTSNDVNRAAKSWTKISKHYGAMYSIKSSTNQTYIGLSFKLPTIQEWPGHSWKYRPCPGSVLVEAKSYLYTGISSTRRQHTGCSQIKQLHDSGPTA